MLGIHSQQGLYVEGNFADETASSLNAKCLQIESECKPISVAYIVGISFTATEYKRVKVEYTTYQLTYVSNQDAWWLYSLPQESVHMSYTWVASHSHHQSPSLNMS